MTAFNSGFYDFDNGEPTARTIAHTIAAGANCAIAMIASGATISVAPTWNGDAMSLLTTRTSGGVNFKYYRLDNPDIGSYNFVYEVPAAYNGAYVTFAAVNDANLADLVRGYDDLYSGGMHGSPITASPAGNLTGDLLVGFVADVDAFSSAHAPDTGSTQIGSTDSRGLAVYKTAGSNGDSTGIAFTGSMVGYLVGSIALKGVVPTLTSPVGNGGTLVCSGSVSTDEANGTLYVVATGSATAPSGVQVEAGQDHTGAAALRVVSQAVTATGSQAVASGAVSAGTRYLHFMHKDAAGNRSAVVSSASFSVSGGGGGGLVIPSRKLIRLRRYLGG